MALMALRAELDALMNSMYMEGLLDQQFQRLLMMQDGDCPGLVEEVITLFFEGADRILAEMTKLLDQTVVDYQKVNAYVHQLKGSSSSVGAQRVHSACMNFHQFYEAGNKDGYTRALHVVKQEYYIVQNKFRAMLRLEQQIQAYENQGQN